ncbi:MAG: right-handed parallel beta-helix repeat-containing protein [Candidatus Accumulibacter sp.]|nr:right-handed parallel beta-helix repeat-containing protein [Accumulibacter sp.]
MNARSLFSGFALAALLLSGSSALAAGPAQAASGADGGRLLRVGPGQALRTIAAAAAQARDGDTIEIEAGDYAADVAVWTRDRLTVRGVGGRVRLLAAGASAEDKAIWVVRGGAMTVENIAFSGARVSGRNGAGIRFEKGRLTVRNCLFEDNENGILTSNDPDAELEIEGSEFGHNGAGDGQSHNLYVGNIRRLKVSGSYFHHARVGHLLKSRAAESVVEYNRLTDEPGGRASYELEFPGGGVAYVIGNLIEQGAQTENPYMISFGSEGYRWPRNELYLSANTLVDERPQGGYFLRVQPGVGRVRAVNNLLFGRSALETATEGAAAGTGEYAGNVKVDAGAFAQLASQDYRLRKRIVDTRLFGKLAVPGAANGVELAPRREYVHPRQMRALAGAPAVPGALQGLAP